MQPPRPACETCLSTTTVRSVFDAGWTVESCHPGHPSAEPCPSCTACRHCLTRHLVGEACPTCAPLIAEQAARDVMVERVAGIVLLAMRVGPREGRSLGVREVA